MIGLSCQCLVDLETQDHSVRARYPLHRFKSDPRAEPSIEELGVSMTLIKARAG